MGRTTKLTQTLGSTRSCCCCKNYCPECNAPKCRPPQEAAYLDGTLNTEYLDRYPEKERLRSLPAAQPGYVPSLAKFDGRTTNRADYTGKQAKMIRPTKKDDPMPDAPFYGDTTYSGAYQGKNTVPSLAAKKAYDPYSAPFEGISSHTADYKNWPADPRTGFSPKYSLTTAPFNGTSTYKDAFDKKQAPPHQPRQPAPMLQSNNIPASTTYAGDFVPKPFIKRAQGPCCDCKGHPAVTVHLASCHTTMQCSAGNDCCSSCAGH